MALLLSFYPRRCRRVHSLSLLVPLDSLYPQSSSILQHTNAPGSGEREQRARRRCGDQARRSTFCAFFFLSASFISLSSLLKAPNQLTLLRRGDSTHFCFFMSFLSRSRFFAAAAASSCRR